MRCIHFFVSAVILPALLGACGGGADSIGFFGDDGAPGAAGARGANALVTVGAEAAGANCAAGGSKIEAGLDADLDGTLTASEVSSTQYVCNGVAGTAGSSGAPGPTGPAGSDGLNALVQMLVEPSGSNCAAGGKVINAGVDDNANGVLDASEISSTGYVCNGVNGSNGTNGADGANGTDGTNGLSALLSITNEPSGVNCAYGGNKVSSGQDINANSMLDLIEISATSYVCNGAPGATLRWINLTASSSGIAVQVVARPNAGYIASDDTRQVIVQLPQTDDSIAVPDPNLAAIGDVLRISGAGLGGWKITQDAGQSVHTASLGGAASTTFGFAGFISGGASDAIELQYIGGGQFVVLSHAGNLTVQ